MRKKACLYFRGIAQTVKAAFKSKCSLRDDSMQDVVEALMIAYTETPEKFQTLIDQVKRRRGKL